MTKPRLFCFGVAERNTRIDVDVAAIVNTTARAEGALGHFEVETAPDCWVSFFVGDDHGPVLNGQLVSRVNAEIQATFPYVLLDLDNPTRE